MAACWGLYSRHLPEHGKRGVARNLSGRPSLPAAFFWVTAFAVAFACVESAVVHYLHVHFYPEGFGWPLAQWDLPMLMVEAAREFSTLVVIAAAAFLAGRSWWRRGAWFMYAFGAWDIFYYVWLVLFEGWPDSPLAPDLLFLLPVPWAGPVAAPVIVSAFLVASALLVIYVEEKRGAFRPGWLPLSLVGAAWALALFSFMADFQVVMVLQAPLAFRWDVFIRAIALWALGLGLAFHASLRSADS